MYATRGKRRVGGDLQHNLVLQPTIALKQQLVPERLLRLTIS
jgi:hypothetical protein